MPLDGLIRYVSPALPKVAAMPPTGKDWQHEVKFDGWRVQLHKHGSGVVLFTKKGYDLTRRFPMIVAAVAALPITSAIIDGELVADRPDGTSDFLALHKRSPPGVYIRVWTFDLLEENGADLRTEPLVTRRKYLKTLIRRAKSNRLLFSGNFDDPLALLAYADAMGLEGIVSKRKDAAYRSGVGSGWLKIKTAVWREANRDRPQLFRKSGKARSG